jgi:hypothetical protein
VSHATPQPVQFDVVFSCVSHPFKSGAVVWQSPQPVLHVYWHALAMHDVGEPWVMSHAAPHCPQFVTVSVGPQSGPESTPDSDGESATASRISPPSVASVVAGASAASSTSGPSDVDVSGPGASIGGFFVASVDPSARSSK